MNTDTPLTDAAIDAHRLSPKQGAVVPYSFARGLERRLAQTQDGLIESMQREAALRTGIAGYIRDSHIVNIQAQVDRLGKLLASKTDPMRDIAKKLESEWIEQERKLRVDLHEYPSTTQRHLARADAIQECRRALQEAFGLVNLPVSDYPTSIP